MKFEAKGPQQREEDNFGFQKSWIREENKSNIKTEGAEKRKITKNVKEKIIWVSRKRNNMKLMDRDSREKLHKHFPVITQ